MIRSSIFYCDLQLSAATLHLESHDLKDREKNTEPRKCISLLVLGGFRHVGCSQDHRQTRITFRLKHLWSYTRKTPAVEENGSRLKHQL